MHLTHNRLYDLIEAAGHESHFHRGPDMSGDHCIAFTVRDGVPEVRVMADILAHAGTVAECVVLLRGVRTSGLGGCTTFYWPEMSLPEETCFGLPTMERGAESCRSMD